MCGFYCEEPVTRMRAISKTKNREKKRKMRMRGEKQEEDNNIKSAGRARKRVT